MLALRVLLLAACLVATSRLAPLATQAVRAEREAIVLAPTSVPIDPVIEPVRDLGARADGAPHVAPGPLGRSVLVLLPLILPLPLPLALALPAEPRDALVAAGVPSSAEPDATPPTLAPKTEPRAARTARRIEP